MDIDAQEEGHGYFGKGSIFSQEEHKPFTYSIMEIITIAGFLETMVMPKQKCKSLLLYRINSVVQKIEDYDIFVM